MKKSIKRILVMAQVLGLSALVATACTKNASETKPADTAAKSNNENKSDNSQKNELSKENNTIKLADPQKLDLTEQEKVRKELANASLFSKDNLTKIIEGTYTSNDGQVKGLVDKFPVSISNDQGEKVKPSEDSKQFLSMYGDQLENGGLTSDKKVAPSTAIDPNKKSIDGVNGKLDPIQAAPPKK